MIYVYNLLILWSYCGLGQRLISLDDPTSLHMMRGSILSPIDVYAITMVKLCVLVRLVATAPGLEYKFEMPESATINDMLHQVCVLRPIVGLWISWGHLLIER